eukprot:TRINITY_DN4502_c0_g1_i4.p1 TRINITY_DN4502_c0_g1~~TRINITY_DN4502_c0_g1_i4.p1  ORF type:complete len:410 (+),score=75.38 TRINITY_DN4502_c0_g1_i4:248-1477(+)
MNACNLFSPSKLQSWQCCGSRVTHRRQIAGLVHSGSVAGSFTTCRSGCMTLLARCVGCVMRWHSGPCSGRQRLRMARRTTQGELEQQLRRRDDESAGLRRSVHFLRADARCKREELRRAREECTRLRAAATRASKLAEQRQQLRKQLQQSKAAAAQARQLQLDAEARAAATTAALAEGRASRDAAELALAEAHSELLNRIPLMQPPAQVVPRAALERAEAEAETLRASVAEYVSTQAEMASTAARLQQEANEWRHTVAAACSRADRAETELAVLLAERQLAPAEAANRTPSREAAEVRTPADAGRQHPSACAFPSHVLSPTRLPCTLFSPARPSASRSPSPAPPPVPDIPPAPEAQHPPPAVPAVPPTPPPSGVHARCWSPTPQSPARQDWCGVRVQHDDEDFCMRDES